MGRLTLNILLSFAQFEREVTGERIRDKFAASKMKGMWMGGPPPLGYDVVDRKLLINKEEAKQVNHIFKRFTALGSLFLLATELNNNGYRTKSYISQTGGKKQGGKIYTVNTLRTVLKNRLYIGEVHHKGKYYPGQHKDIVSYHLFEEVQSLFKEKSGVRRKRTLQIKSEALLKGIISCGSCGGALSPTYTNKGTKKYRYYVGNAYRRHSCEACSNLRIPAGEIENIAIGQVKTLFAAPEEASSIIRLVKKQNRRITKDKIYDALNKMNEVWELMLPAEQKNIIHLLIANISVKASGLDIEYRAEGIEGLVDNLQGKVNE